MRLRIDKIWLIVVALVLSVPSAHAQIVTANPLEWMALAEGNEAINGEIAVSYTHLIVVRLSMISTSMT